MQSILYIMICSRAINIGLGKDIEILNRRRLVVDWIHLAQDRDRRRTEMTSSFHKRWEISWPTKQLSDSQELCSMDLAKYTYIQLLKKAKSITSNTLRLPGVCSQGCLYIVYKTHIDSFVYHATVIISSGFHLLHNISLYPSYYYETNTDIKEINWLNVTFSLHNSQSQIIATWRPCEIALWGYSRHSVILQGLEIM
jgi:hypothetical protein